MTSQNSCHCSNNENVWVLFLNKRLLTRLGQAERGQEVKGESADRLDSNLQPIELKPSVLPLDQNERAACNNSGSHIHSSSGVERAASPWPTLGIRSCRTFCSDLA